jgi:hypothetical protein
LSVQEETSERKGEKESIGKKKRERGLRRKFERKYDGERGRNRKEVRGEKS